MTTMTQEQREYFIRRLNTITQEKIKAREVELFGEGGLQQPTWGMVFAAIQAGEIVLKEGTENLTRPYLMPTDVEWPALDAKKQELCDYQGQLDRERQAIMDAVMLDNTGTEALARYAAL
jgi:hypothetical protein